jgi:hypothetical protein
MFDKAYKEKFMAEYDKMEITDIVPLFRVQYKGPKLYNTSLDQLFEHFFIANVGLLEEI